MGALWQPFWYLSIPLEYLKSLKRDKCEKIQVNEILIKHLAIGPYKRGDPKDQRQILHTFW